MKLAIVIVNYRTAQLTVECLQSIFGSGLVPAQILVVDNASGDDSVATIESAIAREGWKEVVTLMISNENRGFAAGNNLALRQLLHGNAPAPDYILLLNPDTI